MREAVCCSGHGLDYRSRDEALAQEEFLHTHYKRETLQTRSLLSSVVPREDRTGSLGPETWRTCT